MSTINPHAINKAVLANLGLQHIKHCTELTLHMLPGQLPRVIATLHLPGDFPSSLHTITHTVLELSAATGVPPAFDTDRACQEARDRLHAHIAVHTGRERAANKRLFADTRAQQQRRWAREDAARCASQFISCLGNPFEGSIGAVTSALWQKHFGAAA